jgi:hypothetical protein
MDHDSVRLFSRPAAAQPAAAFEDEEQDHERDYLRADAEEGK